jgi:MFS transporter, DHA1 family, multidrug resistance protein
LSRAIARDLFSGNELGRVLSIITVAMAAAPGFSPLVGGGLDHVFGWRSAFAAVAIFGVVIAIAYAFRVGETHSGVRAQLKFVSVLRGYAALLVNRQFIVPAASVALLIGSLFAVFTITPAILVDGLGFSPFALAMFYAGTVFIVFGAGFIAPKLTQRTSLAVAARTGLIIASGGCVVMAILAGTGFRSFASYLLPMLVFLFGMGLANPTCTALTMSPFGARTGAASALLGFMQMATAALAIVTTTVLPVSAFPALAIVLAILTTMAALIFRLRA